MTASAENVRRELTETRLRMDATVAELTDVVSQRVDRVKQGIDPRHYARELPWAALGLALGAGLAIGLSGAERAAADGVVTGAKNAAAAIGDGATSARDAIVERVVGDADSEAIVVATAEPGLRGKLAAALDELLHDGLREILSGIKAPGPAVSHSTPS